MGWISSCSVAANHEALSRLRHGSKSRREHLSFSHIQIIHWVQLPSSLTTMVSPRGQGPPPPRRPCSPHVQGRRRCHPRSEVFGPRPCFQIRGSNGNGCRIFCIDGFKSDCRCSVAGRSFSDSVGGLWSLDHSPLHLFAIPRQSGNIVSPHPMAIVEHYLRRLEPISHVERKRSVSWEGNVPPEGGGLPSLHSGKISGYFAD